MVDRMAALDIGALLARTFHAAALAQLRHFWPSRHDGGPLPAILDSKLRLIVPLVGRLPGGYRFTPGKTWPTRSNGRSPPHTGAQRWVATAAIGRPCPADLFARLYRDYERGEAEAGLLDFEGHGGRDSRTGSERDLEPPRLVRRRKRWFTRRRVPGHDPPPRAAPRVVARRSRRDLAVAATDQTI